MQPWMESVKLLVQFAEMAPPDEVLLVEQKMKVRLDREMVPDCHVSNPRTAP